MVIAIRSAAGDDFAAAEAILRSYNMGQGDLPPVFYVAVDADEIVACGGMALFDGFVWIASVAVAKSRRRNGLGRLMTEALTARAGAWGVPHAWLETMFWNTRFYEHLGFRGVLVDDVPEHVKVVRGNPRCRFMTKALV